MKENLLDTAQIVHLVIAELQGTIKPYERAQLERWIKASPGNEAIYKDFLDPDSLRHEIAMEAAAGTEPNWQKVEKRIADSVGKIMIKVLEKGSAAIALKLFLAGSNRGFNVIDQPEGFYEFHIICDDAQDVYAVGCAHGQIIMSTV